MRRLLNSISGAVLIFLFTHSYCFAGLDLDGTDDNIHHNTFSTIDNATSLSCSAWINSDTANTDDGIMAQVLTSSDGFSFFRDDVGSVSGRTDIINIFVAEGSGTDNARIESATNSATAGVWRNVVFTLIVADSSGLRLYINGVEDANSPVSTSAVANINSGGNRFRIGIHSDASSIPFDGKIADVACWTAVLTANEVAMLASSRVKRIPLQIQPASLFFYLPTDNIAEGTNCTDASALLVIDESNNRNNFECLDGANNTGMSAISEQNISYP